MSQWVDFRLLKHSLDIEKVLAGYRVRLKRVRPGYLRGRCPLPTHSSEESRESFGVDTVKNVWACHSASCRAARQGRVGGHVLDLVAWMEGCSIREAALRVQSRYDSSERMRFEEQLVSKGKEPRPVVPLSFRLRLRSHPYLDARGVEPETAAAFGAGYYDGAGWQHNRIVFPIQDAEGRLVAYAGRSLGEAEPRYLFPRGFRKSQVVFHLWRARGEPAGGTKRVIVVEGFFDCLRVYQCGWRNVVALMGTSLSETQERLLLEHFRELVLMLDGDEAGRRASRQMAARLRGRVSLHHARVPEDSQPDQLSREEMEDVLRTALHGAMAA